jgi:hypothetical protein
MERLVVLSNGEPLGLEFVPEKMLKILPAQTYMMNPRWKALWKP